MTSSVLTRHIRSILDKITLMRKEKLLFLLVSISAAYAQLDPTVTWSVEAGNNYRIFPNVTYVTASNYESKLDVYSRRDTATARPVLVYIHGGGWVAGT